MIPEMGKEKLSYLQEALSWIGVMEATYLQFINEFLGLSTKLGRGDFSEGNQEKKRLNYSCAR